MGLREINEGKHTEQALCQGWHRILMSEFVPDVSVHCMSLQGILVQWKVTLRESSTPLPVSRGNRASGSCVFSSWMWLDFVSFAVFSEQCQLLTVPKQGCWEEAGNPTKPVTDGRAGEDHFDTGLQFDGEDVQTQMLEVCSATFHWLHCVRRWSTLSVEPDQGSVEALGIKLRTKHSRNFCDFTAFADKTTHLHPGCYCGWKQRLFLFILKMFSYYSVGYWFPV